MATIESLSVGTDFDAVLSAVSEKVMKGDVNDDGTIDLLDVDPFVRAIANNCYDPNADVNGDGDDNLLDVAPFVALFAGS